MHANASTGSTLESLIGPFGDSGRYAVSSSVSDLSFRCKATSFRIGVPMRKFRTITAPLYLLLLCAGYCIAQTAAPDSSASISGRVTIGGKGAAGITVAATVSNPSGYDRTVAKIVTDEEGNYRMTRLAAGLFTIIPIAKAFVVGADGKYTQPGLSVNASVGESITKIDFTLVRGSAITGRITDEGGSSDNR